MMRSTATYSTGYQQHSYNAFPQEAAQVHDTKWLLQPVRIQAWYISLLSFRKEKIEKSQLCVTEDDHFSYYGFQRWYMLSNMYKSGNHWILFVILGFHSKAFLSEQWMGLPLRTMDGQKRRLLVLTRCLQWPCTHTTIHKIIFF